MLGEEVLNIDQRQLKPTGPPHILAADEHEALGPQLAILDIPKRAGSDPTIDHRVLDAKLLLGLIAAERTLPLFPEDDLPGLGGHGKLRRCRDQRIVKLRKWQLSQHRGLDLLSRHQAAKAAKCCLVVDVLRQTVQERLNAFTVGRDRETGIAKQLCGIRQGASRDGLANLTDVRASHLIDQTPSQYRPGRKLPECIVGEGYEHIKLHEIDVDCIRAARQAAGPQARLMLDVNCPWTLGEALRVARVLREVDPFWLEEPVWPPEDDAALARIRRECGIPIAAGENAATPHQFAQLLRSGAVDILQPSPAKCGGISTLRKVFALADEYNARVVPHTFYDGPGLLAGLHCAAVFQREPFIEWRFFDVEAPVYKGRCMPAGGRISVPDGPGLGADPDPDVLKEFGTR